MESNWSITIAPKNEGEKGLRQKIANSIGKEPRRGPSKVNGSMSLCWMKINQAVERRRNEPAVWKGNKEEDEGEPKCINVFAQL